MYCNGNCDDCLTPCLTDIICNGGCDNCPYYCLCKSAFFREVSFDENTMFP